MLAARKKKFQPPLRISSSSASPGEFLTIPQPRQKGSTSARADSGIRVPARIMTAPALMVPSIAVSPSVKHGSAANMAPESAVSWWGQPSSLIRQDASCARRSSSVRFHDSGRSLTGRSERGRCCRAADRLACVREMVGVIFVRQPCQHLHQIRVGAHRRWSRKPKVELAGNIERLGFAREICPARHGPGRIRFSTASPDCVFCPRVTQAVLRV